VMTEAEALAHGGLQEAKK